ncbi:MAG: sugar ABC transporter ATP-binding protein [Clostridia bacterium]
MSDYVLSLEGIRKSFFGVKVLDNVDFKVKKGTVHALVGGNGAGKSTLMKILTGVYTSDGGVIKIKDAETKIDDYNMARKIGISLIFQELSLVPDLTVAENIFLNREIKQGLIRDIKKMNQKSKEILDDLGIQINVEEKIRNLSVGLCQLIEIAKALSVDSSILIMDEPTSSLSEKETEILFNIMKRLKVKGVSIIYISHRMNEIFRVSDEISVLRDGKLILTEKTSNLNMKLLINHMIGKSVEKTMEWQEDDKRISDEVILQVENLSLGNVLKNISFSVRKGEILGLAGLMGSGRTEIAETLFGLRKPDRGEIILNGKKINLKNNKHAVDNGIVLISEDRRRQGLVLMHTVKDNVVLPNLESLTRGGILRPLQLQKLSDEAVTDFNVKTNSINTTISNLSGGNQQKVVIAKWLKTKPQLLIMDEPTAGVDVSSKGEIIGIIREFAEKQKSVIFISSEIPEMLAVCDRILVLRNGRITAEYNHNEIESEEVLQHAIQK